MRYAINGKFLTQRLTGVQRFSAEIVKALDLICRKEEFVLLIPRGCVIDNFSLDNIEIVECGSLKGILWEQVSFPLYAIKNNLLCINLSNVAPLVKPDVVCIHDMNLIRHPQWFDWKYVFWSKAQYYNSINRSKLILTVSEFSKSEIQKLYPNNRNPIYVISEGWQHILDIQSDEHALRKYGLKKKEYIFSLYQSIPNKNFKWVIETAKRNGNQQFVISGWHNKKVHKKDDAMDLAETLENVKVLGYITDGELKCLIENCKFFLFPSIYEGFGIPPLEALGLGTNVLVSNISIMREVLGNAALYIDPYIFDIDFDNLDGIEEKERRRILEKYSWTRGAEKLYQLLQQVM